MITIEGTELEYPSEYSFDLSPVHGKQAIMNKGYTRHSKNAKHTIKLGWKNLTLAQFDLIVDFYDSQFVNFTTLTFVFEDAKMGEDLGPIEIFMKVDSEEVLINNRRKLNISLYER